MPYKKSPANALGDPTQNLKNFTLPDLQQFTLEKNYSANASNDFHLFYVGRDDVHSILYYILSRVSVSLHLNMYGYDDQQLNDIIMAKVKDPNILVSITLDSSQTSSKTEAAILAEDKKNDLRAFNTFFVIGKSATGQISHTKGFVADGKVGAEGSTNWSRSGEGIFILPGQPGGAGYAAQNNTQSIFTDPDSVTSFASELLKEHLQAASQANNQKIISHSSYRR